MLKRGTASIIRICFFIIGNPPDVDFKTQYKRGLIFDISLIGNTMVLFCDLLLPFSELLNIILVTIDLEIFES